MRETTELPGLPERTPDAHKGTFGHVFILAGSVRMTGAALLTTKAALRSGVGLVTLGQPTSIHTLVAPSLLGAMSLPLPSTPEGSFSRDATQPAMDFAKKADAIGLGPGITTNTETAVFARWIVQRASTPLVLDADGLNCMGSVPTPLRTAAGPRVLTPHPGEAARLIEGKTAEIQADRIGAARHLSERFRAVVLLKGKNTVIADAEGDRYRINRTGNPGMATGGVGDVLTGIVAGFLAQGMEPFDAAVLAAHVHGLAGDIAVRTTSMPALTARDIIRHLGHAFLTLES
jgi:NAD(P)H-hydrate epimerase